MEKHGVAVTGTTSIWPGGEALPPLSRVGAPAG